MDLFLSTGINDVRVDLSLGSSICGSEWEEERRASLSMMSRLVVSARMGIMLGMSPEEFRILRNWGSPVLQEEGTLTEQKSPLLHECTSSIPSFLG